MENLNQDSTGMQRYKEDFQRNKFLKMVYDKASDPTKSELDKILGDVNKESRDTEASAMASRWEAERILDKEPRQYDFGQDQNKMNAAEAGYTGRTPQSTGVNDITNLSQFSSLQNKSESPRSNPINKETINKTIDDVAFPNESTKNYIKQKEDFRAVPYKDVAGNLTVGYGKNIQGMNPQQVQEMYKTGMGKEFDTRISEASKFVDSYSKIPLTDSQKTAFVSLYDNAGPSIAKNAIDVFNSHGIEAAQDYFRKIINAGGVPSQGLINRRQEEASMLSGNVPPSTQQNQNETAWDQSQNLQKINQSIGQGEGQFFKGAQGTNPNIMDVADKRMGVVQQGIGGEQIPRKWEDVGLGTGEKYNPPELQKIDYSKFNAVPSPVKEHQDTAQKQLEIAQDIQSKSPVKTDAMDEAIENLKKHTMESAKLASSGNLEAAKLAAKNADDSFKKLNDIADIQKDIFKKFQKDFNEIDVDVNRNRLWDNMPIANKIVAAVALFAGAMTGASKNQALESLKDAMNNDIQDQKDEYERKGDKIKNAYSIASKYYDGETDRLKMASLIQGEMVNAKLAEIKSKQILPEASAAIDKIIIENENNKRKIISEQLKDQIELQAKLIGAEAQKERGEYYKEQKNKIISERSSPWGFGSVVRKQQLATSFDAIAPRRMETIDLMDNLANQVQALDSVKVWSPSYKRERDEIRANINNLAGRLASLINDKTGGVIVEEAKLSKEALTYLTSVNSFMSALTTRGGALERANSLREWTERIKDGARNAFNGAYMRNDNSRYSKEEIDNMLGFTKPTKVLKRH